MSGDRGLESARERLARRKAALKGRLHGGSPAPLTPAEPPPVMPAPRPRVGRGAWVSVLVTAAVGLMLIGVVVLRDGDGAEVRAIQAELTAGLARDLGLPENTLKDYPLVLCSSPERYAESLLVDVPMREDSRAELLESIRQGEGDGISEGLLRSVGVHLPGRGGYLNGWQIAELTGVEAAEVLESPSARELLLVTAAHEQWGHGFISEMTRLGREKQSVQLGRIGVAEQFELTVVDTPEATRLSRQWSALFLSTHYVEEGFATWVESRLPDLALSASNRVSADNAFSAQYTVEQVIETLSADPQGKGMVQALDTLFNDSELDWNALHAAMGDVIAQAESQAGLFGAHFGLAPPYVLGGAMAHRIEARSGARMVPLAVALACGISYGLAEVSLTDLEHRIETDPMSNVNTRFAALMHVRPDKKNDAGSFNGEAKKRWSAKAWPS